MARKNASDIKPPINPRLIGSDYEPRVWTWEFAGLIGGGAVLTVVIIALGKIF